MSADEYPIKVYALIDNCETAALINPNGGIDRLCLSAFNSPSFSGALLDREQGGHLLIRPIGAHRTEREYLGDTAILRTRFISAESSILLTDFFVIARQPRARFMIFTSLHPTHKLVRVIEEKQGRPVPPEELERVKASIAQELRRLSLTR